MDFSQPFPVDDGSGGLVDGLVRLDCGLGGLDGIDYGLWSTHKV